MRIYIFLRKILTSKISAAEPMAANLRQILWNAEGKSLTEAEEYTIWASHIKTLFLFPSCFFSEYDHRNGEEWPSFEAIHCRAAPIDEGASSTDVINHSLSHSNEEKSFDEGSGNTKSYAWPFCLHAFPCPRLCSSWDILLKKSSSTWSLDDECFPWCFYPRMMRQTSIKKRAESGEEWDNVFLESNPLPLKYQPRGVQSATASRRFDNKQEAASSPSSPFPHGLLITEDEAEAQAAQRLATLLRRRHQKNFRSKPLLERASDTPGAASWGIKIPNSSSKESTCYLPVHLGDPKVEERQAKFMNEATNLLLHTRAQNNLFSELHRQLARTHFILSQIEEN